MRVIKCKLRSVTRTPEVAEQLEQLARQCHLIVTETYLFIRLFVLDCLARNVSIPIFSEEWIACAMGILCRQQHASTKPPTRLVEERAQLREFFEKTYATLRPQGQELYSVQYFSQLQVYLATQMATAYANNIQVHFVKRLMGFVNRTVSPYEIDDVGTAKKDRVQLKQALLNNDASKLPTRYMKWWNTHRAKILPDTWPDGKPLAYDVKVRPLEYLQFSLHQNAILEEYLPAEEARLFQPLPIRTSNVPCYITIDTFMLVKMFVGDVGLSISMDGVPTVVKKSKLIVKIAHFQSHVWNAFFCTERHCLFGKGKYQFGYLIQTDGVGVSILQRHVDYPKTLKRPPPTLASSVENKYGFLTLNELDDVACNRYSKRNVVGVDPGKRNLVFMVDEANQTLRYTAPQRSKESKSVCNRVIMERERKRHDIKERESVLSTHNARTMEVGRFAEFVKVKLSAIQDTLPFYHDPKWRNMKLRHLLRTKSSEDTFVSRMRRTFGAPQDVLVAYGNWSPGNHHLAHSPPTASIGLCRLIARTFPAIVMVDEFRSSKLCNYCHQPLQHLCTSVEGKDKKHHRLQVCTECPKQLVSGKPSTLATSILQTRRVVHSRDVNSAINIRNLARSWIIHLRRPLPFTRNNFSTTSPLG